MTFLPPPYESPSYGTYFEPLGYFVLLINTRPNAQPRPKSVVVFLQGYSPAILSYCIPDWQSRLNDMGQIRLPREDFDFLRQLSLRALRCGGIRVDSSRERVDLEDIAKEQSQRTHRDYIFGWPQSSEGSNAESVWMLRMPERSEDPQKTEWFEERNRIESKLDGAVDMEGYCEVLKEEGGRFYEDVRVCEEARERGLVELEGG